MKKTHIIILGLLLVIVITYPFWGNRLLPSSAIPYSETPNKFIKIEHVRNNTKIQWQNEIHSLKGDQLEFQLQLKKPQHFLIMRMNEDGSMLSVYPETTKVSDYISEQKKIISYKIEDIQPQRLFFFFSDHIIEFDTLRFEITFALRKYQDRPPSLAELSRLPFDWNYETIFIRPEKQ